MRPIAPLLALLSPALLVACSAPAEQAEPAEDGPADPPGVARALSIGGMLDTEGQSEFSINVNCAAAIGSMVDTLKTLNGGRSTPQVRAVQAAADAFEKRALAARTEADLPSVEQAMANWIAGEGADRAKQAQVATACARRLEEEELG